MKRPFNNPFVQIGVLLTAFALGTLLSLSIPSPYVVAGGDGGDMDQRTFVPLDVAVAILESENESNQPPIGVDADPQQIENVSRVG